MADDLETETKTGEEFKVPPFAIDAKGRPTTRGIAEHARAMYARLWDAGQKRFHSLKKAVQLLLVYVPRLADRVADAEEKIAALEAWRAEVDKVMDEGKALAAQLEKEMEANPDLAKLKETIEGKPQLKSLPTPAEENIKEGIKEGIKTMSGLIPSQDSVKSDEKVAKPKKGGAA